MSNMQPSDSVINPGTENPQVLKWAGGLLFALGLIATFIAFTQKVDSEKISMVLYAAVLLSLGYPMLLYVQALRKIAVLEQRINELEQHKR